MSNKVTKTQANKVMKALAEYYGANIMRQGADSPFIPEQDYKFNYQYTDHQEIVWESGDYDWADKFCNWINNPSRKSEFGLQGLHMEPFNDFVVQISRW